MAGGDRAVPGEAGTTFDPGAASRDAETWRCGFAMRRSAFASVCGRHRFDLSVLAVWLAFLRAGQLAMHQSSGVRMTALAGGLSTADLRQRGIGGCQSSLQMPPPIIESNATTSDISQSTVRFQIDGALLTACEAVSTG
jgi:hypothetical protein